MVLNRATQTLSRNRWEIIGTENRDGKLIITTRPEPIDGTPPYIGFASLSLAPQLSALGWTIIRMDQSEERPSMTIQHVQP